MTEQPLKKEFQYFLDHQDDLVKRYSGKFIVIKDEDVKGAYNSEVEAIAEASKQFEPGTFLVQECQGGSDIYTQTFHSRVVI